MDIQNIKDALILIVDDSTFMRKRTKTSLNANGFNNTIEAADGKEAIGLVDLKKPDIVLLDMYMAEMDGMQALTYIKEKYHDEVICIMISAVDNKTIIQKSLEIGAYAYLIKPLNDKEVIDIVTQSLASKGNKQ